jgi:hypothetical protein
VQERSGITRSALCLVVAVILIFATCIATRSASFRLVGCQNPTTIAEALTKLRESKWRNVSVIELSKIWPIRLTPADCDSVECKSASSEDRIIAGECECCEIFFFDKEEGSSQRGQLDNVIIHYSSSDRRETIEAGKTFARAAGFAESDVAMVGQQSPQHFEWDSSEENIYFAVEIHLNKRGSLWDLYFNLGTGALTR